MSRKRKRSEVQEEWEEDEFSEPESPSQSSTSLVPLLIENDEKPLKVVILYGKSSNEEIMVTTLPHPATGEDVRFLLRGKCLIEIQKMQPENDLGCWFINDSVSSDGSLYVATPFDPLFIAIYLFSQGNNDQFFKSIDDILTESATEKTKSGMRHLQPILNSSRLEKICDSKQIGELQYFRLNNSLVMNFLAEKVIVIAKELVENELDLDASKFRVKLVESNYENTSDQEYIHKAIRILGEYLSEIYLSKLKEKFQCSEKDLPTLTEDQRKQLAYANSPQLFMNRQKEANEKGEILKKSASGNSGQRSKEKGLREAKEKLNLKSITSFFSPSSKQKPK